MAGQNHRGRKKRPNRQGKTNKGPQTPDDERLWRRVTQHFTDQAAWQQAWTPEELVAHIADNEGLKAQFRGDEKAERSLLSKVNEALALGRKQQGYILPDEGKSVRFRSEESINELDSAANRWKNFFSRHGGKGETPLSGRPPLNEEATQEDRDSYALLEETWDAMLRDDRLPEGFALDQTGTRQWKGFDLVKEARQCAVKRSGLRFRDEEPAMALLLMTAERWTARELLDARLATRRKAGHNPFPRTYDARLVAHADGLGEVDGDGEISKGRSDLRHLPFVTIDPPDAKDFDDAVCLVKADGIRTLWVAIADVAHYVQAGTSLDRAAAARATSVYLPHAVLPMLPPKLADELCSLRADIDRLAMVVGMDLDDDNTIVHTHAYEAVIHVKANIAYGDVLNTDAYDEMLELAGIWQEREIRLNLNNPELRPRLHGENELRVEVKWPNKATRMIESFMVATNAAVGHLLGEAGAPLPWRCHAPPDRPEVQGLNAKLEALGVGIQLPMPSLRKHGESETQELSNLLGDWANLGGGGIDLSELKEDEPESDVPLYLREVIDPEARDGILTSLQKAQASASSLAETTRRIVDQGLFQLMTRAKYSEENEGHFGLNLDAYVHFTSPIRRYPDLMTHRQLKAFIHGRDWVHDESETARLASHCSEQGMAAKRLEWELVANTYHVHLLRGGRIGEDESPIPTSYNARVTGLRTPWIFLDLADDGAVSGRMHLRQLGGKQRLVVDDFGLTVSHAEPDNSGEYPAILRLGQRFPCRLRGLDVWSGSLDLTPV
ncbi:ribonuclease R [Candidatus Poseidonia sp.]|nr:ribonuclease R [Poseidonia sp.]